MNITPLALTGTLFCVSCNICNASDSHNQNQEKSSPTLCIDEFCFTHSIPIKVGGGSVVEYLSYGVGNDTIGNVFSVNSGILEFHPHVGEELCTSTPGVLVEFINPEGKQGYFVRKEIEDCRGAMIIKNESHTGITVTFHSRHLF